MNIKRAKEEIKNCIEAYLLKDEHGVYEIPSANKRPFLLYGPPGIGKTQIVEQIAGECGVGLVTYTITHQTGESAISQPYLERRRYNGQEYVVTEHTMSGLVSAVYDYIERTGIQEGILFIDEFDELPDILQPAMRQFLQYKIFGGYKLPEGFIIVIAQTSPEYRNTIRETDVGLSDRVVSLNLNVDFETWKSYAFEHALHPAVISYLDANRDYLFCVELGDEGPVFATPRGWEDLARIIKINEKLGKKIDKETVRLYIEHSNIAKDFIGFLPNFNIFKLEYRIARVLDGDSCNDLAIRISNAPLSEKNSVINLLIDRLNVQFRNIYYKEMYLEFLLEQLKQIKSAALRRISAKPSEETGGDGGVPEYLGYLRVNITNEMERRKKLELISREEVYAWQQVLDRLRIYNRSLVETGRTSWREGFKQVCLLFEKESGEYEQICEKILSMMECAFDFLEASFGNGPEVVRFVTDLNANSYSSRFLRDNKCERYYEYNKRLVFENKEDSLRNRLARL